MLSFILGLPSHAACDKRYVYTFLNTKPGYQVEKNGLKSGISYLILDEISRRMGCLRTEEPTSYAAAKENFNKRRADIFGVTFPDVSLDEVGEYIEIFQVPRVLIVRKNFFRTKDSIQGVLKNQKVKFAGIISGRFFITPQEKEILYKSGRIIEFPSPDEIFKALLNGRVGATFSSPAFIHYYVKSIVQDHKDEFEIVPDETFMDSLGIYVSKKRLSQAEREALRKIAKEIKQDGTLLRIASSYVDPSNYKYYKP